MTDWKTNLINDSAGIAAVIRDTKSIAVLGIKPESHADQAGYYVPALTKLTKETANAIGEVTVDMNGTACKVPSAAEYIAKIENGHDTLLLQDGSRQVTLVPLSGTNWPKSVVLGSGWTVQSSSAGVQFFTFKRIMF